jgi:UDP-N-acetylmuramyl-tripeptide synthetase/UDP-N-acetylmuramoyl-tripeptide--D-alanyl-D-alanine ligase
LGDYLALLRSHDLLVSTQALDGLDLLQGEPRTDNRKLQPGDIFFCIKGFSADGHRFIPDARAQGAALIVGEEPIADNLAGIRVKNSRRAAALAAKLYYGDPTTSFRLIGVTGTNGKTTTSMLLFKALRELSFAAGWIGTLGYQINEIQYTTSHTTPDILELNAIFAEMAAQKVSYVVMEVSSHALALDRVYGAEFDFCLFTNLSREHLDFHGDMESYGAAKLTLFEAAASRSAVAVVNIDDAFGARIHANLLGRGGYVFSVGGSEADFVIRDDTGNHNWQQSKFTLSHGDIRINIRSSLIGSFNILNLSLCAAMLSVIGFEPRQIAQALNAAKPVRGRFEQVPNPHGIGVFIDYAHTPDALENVTKAARELNPGRLLCLIGAGGDRDQGKRPLMLKAALQHSDAVIISDDNPRTENPDRIIRDIVRDSHPWLPWWIIRDRKQAIEAIIELARPGDIVLICGKGHETYQEIEGIRHEFDDRAEAARILESYPGDNDDALALPVDRLMLELLFNLEPEETKGYRPPATYKHVSTDTRTLKPNSVFFALKGENYDAHAFIPAVLAGNGNLVVGDMDLPPQKGYLKTDESLIALGLLCRKYLQMFDVYKVAITGSTGKSTTKEIMAQVLSVHQPVLKSLANANNMIGLCQTILRIQPRHLYAVLELGTNHFGEIAALTDTCSPDAAVILNIGPSHLEFLIDEEGVFKEKSALFDRPLEIRLFDADDDRFEAFQNTGKGVGFSEKAGFRISAVDCGERQCSFKLNEEDYVIPYNALHYVKNCAFAIALARLRDIPAQTIGDALSSPVSLELRLQVEQLLLGILVADCYNANPVSMQKAIEYWRGLAPGSKHVAILGDMLELGEQTEMYHDMIAAILLEHGCDRLLTVGNLAWRYHGSHNPVAVQHFACVDDLMRSGVLSTLEPGSVILVKGSHGIHLERLLPILRERT